MENPMIAIALQYTDIPWLDRERDARSYRPRTECVSSPWGAGVSSGSYYTLSSRVGAVPGVSILLSAILEAHDEKVCSLTTPEIPAALAEIRDALSLNISQLSNVLLVTRQTIYNWDEGKPVDESNRRRVAAVRELALTWLRDHGKPMGSVVAEEFDGESLISLFQSENFDEQAILRKFEAIAARIAVAESNPPPSARELAAKFGLEPVSKEEQRKNLFVAGLRHSRGR
jgi:hypothetical protein